MRRLDLDCQPELPHQSYFKETCHFFCEAFCEFFKLLLHWSFERARLLSLWFLCFNSPKKSRWRQFSQYHIMEESAGWGNLTFARQEKKSKPFMAFRSHGLSSPLTWKAVSCRVQSRVNRRYSDIFQGSYMLIKGCSCEVFQQPRPKPLSNIQTVGWDSAILGKTKIGKRELGREESGRWNRTDVLTYHQELPFIMTFFSSPGP